MIGLLPPEPNGEEPEGPRCGVVDPITGAVCTRAEHGGLGSHRDESDPQTQFHWKTSSFDVDEDDE